MKKINLVFDVGNTNTVVGLYKQKDIVELWRLKSEITRTEDEYFGIINSLITRCGMTLDEITTCAISSVVPEVRTIFNYFASKYLRAKVINVNANTKLGLKFPMEDPCFIGADLIVNAFAAKTLIKQNCIVCDFGTATTVQLVGKDGFFYGTAICPGLKTSANTLFRKASLLSDIDFRNTDKIIGQNTEDALLAGIIKGHAFMVDGIIDEIKQKYSRLKNIKTIATGGISEMIINYTKNIDIADPKLTLDGLNYICLIEKEL